MLHVMREPEAGLRALARLANTKSAGGRSWVRYLSGSAGQVQVRYLSGSAGQVQGNEVYGSHALDSLISMRTLPSIGYLMHCSEQSQEV